jgi:hypothetical protein
MLLSFKVSKILSIVHASEKSYCSNTQNISIKQKPIYYFLEYCIILIGYVKYPKGEFYMQVMNKDRHGKHMKRNQLNMAKQRGKKIVGNKVKKG